MDRPIRHDDRRLIVLEQRGKRSNRRLVASDHGNDAREPCSTEMLAQRVVRNLASNQRVTHLARAVADSIRYPERVLGLDETRLELALARADAGLESCMDRVDLRQDSEIALAIALGADDAHRGFMDQIGIGADRPGEPDGLR